MNLSEPLQEARHPRRAIGTTSDRKSHFSAEAPRKVHVLRHDGDAPTVYGAKVGVLEKPNLFSLAGRVGGIGNIHKHHVRTPALKDYRRVWERVTRHRFCCCLREERVLSCKIPAEPTDLRDRRREDRTRSAGVSEKKRKTCQPRLPSDRTLRTSSGWYLRRSPFRDRWPMACSCFAITSTLHCYPLENI